MILTLCQEMNDEAVERVGNAYNSLPIANPETGQLEHLNILLNSEGGSVGAASMITTIINEHKDITTLIAYQTIASCAFRLFFEVKCPKTINPNTIGMYHLTRWGGLNIYEGNVTINNYYENFVLQEMKNKKYLIETSKLAGFTEDEYDRILKNEDVWFSYNRLIKMLKHNNKILK